MFLLDTNVVSELRKAKAGKAHPNVIAWARTAQESSLFLSVVVVQELEIGVLQLERKDPGQGEILRQWLNGHVLPIFASRVLPIDTAVARCFARLQVPDPLPYPDGLIAATALVHDLTIVTRNVADFRRTGVLLLNPWDEGTR
jgi:predicted nucleic acid-binding protein